MAHEIEAQHAKALAQVSDQSAHWKLQPEKKPPFTSVEQVNDYVMTHNEPLYLRVPLANEDEHLLVKVTSSDADIVFSAISFDNPASTRVHMSHLKLATSSVTEMLNDCLPEGKKVASF